MFNNQHIVITGGSSGLGLELARLLAAEGARLTLIARNLQKLEQADYGDAFIFSHFPRHPNGPQALKNNCVPIF